MKVLVIMLYFLSLDCHRRKQAQQREEVLSAHLRGNHRHTEVFKILLSVKELAVCGCDCDGQYAYYKKPTDIPWSIHLFINSVTLFTSP